MSNELKQLLEKAWVGFLAEYPKARTCALAFSEGFEACVAATQQIRVSVEQVAEIEKELLAGKMPPGRVEVLPESKEVAHWKEQARLQEIRADQELAAKLALEERVKEMGAAIERLNQTGGSERASRYIALLLSKLEQAGVKRSEFDQEGTP